MVDFTSILSLKADGVEKPKPKPTGSYLAAIVGHPAQKEVKVQGEEKPIISFQCKVIAPGPDVSLSSEDGDPSSWAPFRHDIWVDGPEGQYRLRAFLENTLGLAVKGKSFSELLAEVPGKQLMIVLKHRPYIDRDSGEAAIAAEIGTTAKA
jgi:hypothetical protein